MLEHVVEITTRRGGQDQAVYCVRSLGDIALARSDFNEARGWYERALALYRLVGDAEGEGKAVRGIGDIAARFDHDKARSRYGAALALFERIALPLLIGETHQRLAKIARSDEERRRHLTIVRNEWRSVGLTPLISALDAEFGSGSCCRSALNRTGCSGEPIS